LAGFWRGALLGFVGLLLGIQAIRPIRTNPPVNPSHTLEATVPVPSHVQTILQRSCFDCHSDQTRWPWYSNVAPVSWFVIDHVDSGRRHANFSEWLRRDTKDPTQYTRERFEAICKQVQTHDMPLWSYLLIHRDAWLSPADIDAICRWTRTDLVPANRNQSSEFSLPKSN
jgi:hypothetical protein